MIDSLGFGLCHPWCPGLPIALLSCFTRKKLLCMNYKRGGREAGTVLMLFCTASIWPFDKGVDPESELEADPATRRGTNYSNK